MSKAGVVPELQLNYHFPSPLARTNVLAPIDESDIIRTIEYWDVVSNLVIYGQADGDSVVSLCFAYNKAPQLAAEKAELLVTILERHQLLVVHWPSATKLDLRAQFIRFLTQSL